MNIRWPRVALALAALVLGIGGCAQIRLLTYPAEFVWLDERDVQDVMHRMADRLIRLDELIGGDGGADSPSGVERRRRAVDDELRSLEELGTMLAVGAGGVGEERGFPRTNHLLIDEHIDEFVADIARARRFAAEEPPDYYPAGRLGGSCTGCHRWRGEAS